MQYKAQAVDPFIYRQAMEETIVTPDQLVSVLEAQQVAAMRVRSTAPVL
jgi:hypothetical protein